VARIGVFVCHCGENIARTVDVSAVSNFAATIPGVAHSAHYPYLCSAPGQKLLAEAVRTHRLTGVLVVACSPHIHEPTFRRAVARAGLNPFLCELANIREQCSWVHRDRSEATVKAIDIVAGAVERLKRSRPLEPLEVPVTRRVLVIGGGVAGIRAALDVANAGHEVILVEREPSIGGNMARLSETFPTLDCSQCILTPLMVEVSRHPNIELMAYSEVEEVNGSVGNFRVRIRRKPRYVRNELCTSCGACALTCPAPGPNEFDLGLATRKAIYIPFPQAVPSTYTLDADRCLNAGLESKTGFRMIACHRCEEACLPNAIDFDAKPEIAEREVGAVVLATGFQLSTSRHAEACGYGRLEDVMDGLEFERLLSAAGPTGGEIRRPSDGKTPKDVVFIQCVGSRDPRYGVPYCSRICCMATAKHALLYRHKVPDGRAYVFYMDIRAAGKGYEEFVHRVAEEERALYVRGRVSEVIRDGGKLIVYGSDTLSGQAVQVRADLVVLAMAAVPAATGDFASKLRVATDANGFFQEAHPKLRPVETLTAGVFLAGAAHGPKDIPDSVAQASAAASKALELMSRPVLQREPAVAAIEEKLCVGCLACVEACGYGAIEPREIRSGDGRLLRIVARVNPAVCEGCGVCTVVCRSGAADLAGASEEQVFSQLGAVGSIPASLLKR
jgi:heterodisulfide reductase subunit A